MGGSHYIEESIIWPLPCRTIQIQARSRVSDSRSRLPSFGHRWHSHWVMKGEVEISGREELQY